MMEKVGVAVRLLKAINIFFWPIPKATKVQILNKSVKMRFLRKKKINLKKIMYVMKYLKMTQEVICGNDITNRPAKMVRTYVKDGRRIEYLRQYAMDIEKGTEQGKPAKKKLKQ